VRVLGAYSTIQKVLYCTILYSTVLYCSVTLHYTTSVLYSTVLYSTIAAYGGSGRRCGGSKEESASCLRQGPRSMAVKSLEAHPEGLEGGWGWGWDWGLGFKPAASKACGVIPPCSIYPHKFAITNVDAFCMHF